MTEFGYVGLGSGTFDNPENSDYEYGLFMGDFAIEVLNARASAALMWCLFDQYYDATHCQRYGLWEFKDHGWRPRPAFYSWSMINRHTEKGSRVVAWRSLPQAESVRGAALLSPRRQAHADVREPLRPRHAVRAAHGAGPNSEIAHVPVRVLGARCRRRQPHSLIG